MSDEHVIRSQAENEQLPDWLQTVSSSEQQPAKQKFSAFGVTAVLLIVGLLIVVGYALYQRSQTTPENGPAPKFTTRTFDFDEIAPYDDQSMHLSELRGNVVVINFWASYCEPCKLEARTLEQIWRDYEDQGVIFLGINTDDTEPKALEYLREYDITYPNAPDEGGIIEDLYRITGIPETFVVDRDGNIQRHFISEVNDAVLRREIDAALDS
jgi:cytochrome c biogenesis protein CcmG/thiol:disulfide interchange protein DsbE